MFSKITTTEIQPLLLTTREAAKMLAVCERTVINMSERGDLRCVRIGTAVRYAIADIKAFIARASEKREENSCSKCNRAVDSVA